MWHLGNNTIRKQKNRMVQSAVWMENGRIWFRIPCIYKRTQWIALEMGECLYGYAQCQSWIESRNSVIRRAEALISARCTLSGPGCLPSGTRTGKYTQTQGPLPEWISLSSRGILPGKKIIILVLLGNHCPVLMGWKIKQIGTKQCIFLYRYLTNTFMG